MFPHLAEAPAALFRLPGHCGPMSVWLVLRHFKKRVGAARIIRACRHTDRRGCYSIALALALHEFGLRVAFHTDPDPEIEPLEARCYQRARGCGIPIEPALGVPELRQAIRGRLAIVYLAGRGGAGHFSPLVEFRRGQAVLPSTDRGRMSVEAFERCWSGPGFPRQCMLVEAEPGAAADGGGM